MLLKQVSELLDGGTAVARIRIDDVNAAKVDHERIEDSLEAAVRHLVVVKILRHIGETGTANHKIASRCATAHSNVTRHCL